MSEENRFAFGDNWKAYLAALDDDRINQAVTSLQSMLGVESLVGKRFLDLGCGSGLFSLAAHRMGASVVSIDYDAVSVGCTEELLQRFASTSGESGPPDWEIKQGSVLDESLMQSLGQADVVYSWGVLHHTGDMQRAIDLAADRTKPGGLFFIAIYNDQGGASRRWLAIKKTYNWLPSIARSLWVATIAGLYEMKFALSRLVRLQNPLPFRDWREKKQDRGMSAWHDWVDWIGGLPFQVATPEQIIVPLRKRGFVLQNLKTVGSGWGCNEYVFTKLDLE